MAEQMRCVRGAISVFDLGTAGALTMLVATVAATPPPGIGRPSTAPVRVRLARLPGESAGQVCERAALPREFCRHGVDLTARTATITIDSAPRGGSDDDF